MHGVRHIHNGSLCHLIIIDTFSVDLQNSIRSRLCEICWGKDIAAVPSRQSDYKSTLASFLDRYEQKTSRQKTGIIGELLAHVLIRQYMNHLEPASILFNKEERSMRKGFDLIFFESDNETVWYSEVKAGTASSTQTPTDKSLQLLSTASNDITSKLTSAPDSAWDSAVFDSNLTVSANVRPLLRQILNKDAPSVRDNNFTAAAILVSVVYADPAVEVEHDKLTIYRDTASLVDLFEALVVISIQKKTVRRVADFLRKEAT